MKANGCGAGRAALSLAACSTVNPYTNEQQLSKTSGGTIIGNTQMGRIAASSARQPNKVPMAPNQWVFDAVVMGGSKRLSLACRVALRPRRLGDALVLLGCQADATMGAGNIERARHPTAIAEQANS